MKNQPVAWINLERWRDTSSYLEDCVADMKLESAGIVIPLYTHPVEEQDESFDRTASHMAGEYVSYPVKELTMTDDEVMDLWNEQSSHPIDFARAILLKAQEK